jgi:hypothetical protein
VEGKENKINGGKKRGSWLEKMLSTAPVRRETADKEDVYE